MSSIEKINGPEQVDNEGRSAIEPEAAGKTSGWTREKLATAFTEIGVDIKKVESVGEIVSYESPEEAQIAIKEAISRFPQLQELLQKYTVPYTAANLPRKVPIRNCTACEQGRMHAAGSNVINGKRGLGRLFVCTSCGMYGGGR